jgi:hypothetical protein
MVSHYFALLQQLNVPILKPSIVVSGDQVPAGDRHSQMGNTNHLTRLIGTDKLNAEMARIAHEHLQAPPIPVGSPQQASVAAFNNF